MRAPPAVSIEARAGPVWRAFQAALHGWAAGAFALWASQTLGWDSAGVAGSALIAVGAAAFGWQRSVQTTSHIAWSGAQWSVARVGEPFRPVRPPQVRLDLGTWMLLRVEPESAVGAVWIAAGQVDAGAAWRPFRAAVYSSASAHEPRSLEERPPF